MNPRAMSNIPRRASRSQAGAPTLAPVRRWLSILLLVLLPLQFGWTAVAAYCEHETRTESQHLGHHEHPEPGHENSWEAHLASPDAPSGGFHFDCGHCHGQIAVLHLLVADLPADLSGGSFVAAPSDASRAPPSPRPERPQWARLA